jgi:hypothetical protein
MEKFARRCENCGLGMLPWMPRKRVDGKLICLNCREGRPGRPRAQATRSGAAETPDALSSTMLDSLACYETIACQNCGRAVTATGGLQVKEGKLVCVNGCEHNANASYASGGLSPWLVEAMERESVRIESEGLQVEAHDSGDGQTIYHCPFCGGGQVIGRGDGTTECDFCHTSFTVQVQPQIAAMPQTVNGVPQEMPGMPGGPPGPDAPFDQDAPGGGPQPAQAPQPATDAFVPPGGAGVLPDAPGGAFVPPQKKAAAKSFYVGPEGAVMPERSYIHHLALRFADDRDAVLADIQEANSR